MNSISALSCHPHHLHTIWELHTCMCKPFRRLSLPQQLTAHKPTSFPQSLSLRTHAATAHFTLPPSKASSPSGQIHSSVPSPPPCPNPFSIGCKPTQMLTQSPLLVNTTRCAPFQWEAYTALHLSCGNLSQCHPVSTFSTSPKICFRGNPQPLSTTAALLLVVPQQEETAHKHVSLWDEVALLTGRSLLTRVEDCPKALRIRN